MNFLYHAHSGLRYLVLLAALVAIVALAYALATGRASRATRVLPAIFTGLLDLQVLLGIALVIGGLMPDIVVGHLVMMVIALIVAHGASIHRRESVPCRVAGTVARPEVAGLLAAGRQLCDLWSFDQRARRHAPDPLLHRPRHSRRRVHAHHPR